VEKPSDDINSCLFLMNKKGLTTKKALPMKQSICHAKAFSAD
jgi:hypothetical protein